jgi:hypothetical protein
MPAQKKKKVPRTGDQPQADYAQIYECPLWVETGHMADGGNE